ncbi:hypothetical protein [Komagataeibacter xylinus]|nr:hypothetical protein [Komagataeibacter xylinus]
MMMGAGKATVTRRMNLLLQGSRRFYFLKEIFRKNMPSPDLRMSDTG